MNYRHLYHAGNFADVIKHVVLIVLLQSLKRKETPFCFLDTHAGIGLYELQSEQSQKKREYENGIGKLFSLNEKTLPLILQNYLSIIKKYNIDDHLNYYPGSPCIAKELIRSQDQMILCELHKEDYHTLKDNFFGEKNAGVHLTDGYLAMKAFLPPKQKRGLVLIDPPFEVSDEFEKIFFALERALKHWRSGQFAVWYPIKDQTAVKKFYHSVKLLKTEQLILHFSLNNATEAGKLASCGILFINPPWQLKETLESVLPILFSALQATGGFVLP